MDWILGGFDFENNEFDTSKNWVLPLCTALQSAL